MCGKCLRRQGKVEEKMATVIKTIGINGICGYTISVQAKTLAGLSTVNIIGLGDQAVKESRDRIEAAFDQIGSKFPSEKVIINLAPSDIKKSGTSYDLAMVIGLLIESGELDKASDLDIQKTIFLGEVGLTGELCHFKGVLPMVAHAAREGFKQIIVPAESVTEVSMVKGVDIIPFSHVEEVVLWLKGKISPKAIEPIKRGGEDNHELDFKDVHGHEEVLRYVLAAAAGNHNLLMIGPPGCGKSMIAKRIAGILPELSETEKLELMSIQSIAGLLKTGQASALRPFRAPHYNTSSSAIVGGGTNAMPGEISLAHHGILFLDELPEFSPKVIDALRQPLEDGLVTVARVKQTNTYPANFMLVAAMNPCKCGHFGSNTCRCRRSDVNRYQNRISGPIYDRLDIQKYLTKVDIISQEKSVSSKWSTIEMKERVIQARRIQKKRFENDSTVSYNGQMEISHIKKYCGIENAAQKSFERFNRHFAFSARSYGKIMSVARTFADLSQSEKIRESDIVDVVMGRDLDRKVNQIGG